MSLISRLRAVVAGDDFLDSDFDELDYETSDDFENFNRVNKEGSTEMATISQANPFNGRSGFPPSNVIGMPGISTNDSEVSLMEPEQAQRAVEFVAGGTFAIDGHQERVGESIFLFAPSCVNVTSSFPEEASPSNVPTKKTSQYNSENNITPEPAWGESKLSAYS